MRPISLALLVALTGCSDDGPASTATASASGTGTTDAATTPPTTGATDTTTSSGATDSATATATVTTSAASSDSGEPTTTDATTTPTATDTTTTAPADPTSAVAPKWLRQLDGLNFRPFIAALPDGDVAALITGGLYAHQLVLAEGDADEQQLASMFVAPALARFDGQSGALVSARMLAKLGQNAPYGMSARSHQLTVAGNGDLLVAGNWVGLVEFFPGTADSTTLLAEIKQNGNNLDRAEEPYFFRLTPAGAVTWLVRGRTPPGIATTWFNDAKGIAALPGDDVLIVGDYESDGFVVAHGTAGAKTMTGSQASYFARLGADGSPAWVHRNSQRLPFNTLRGNADGTLYAQLPADATLFADADAPTQTMSEPGMMTGVIGRIDPNGGALWTANVAASAANPLRSFVVTASGDLVLHGEIAGELLVRDAAGTVMNAASDSPQAFVAALDPTGAGLWLRPLGPTVTSYGPALAGSDGVWLAAQISAPHVIEIAGQSTPLPALGYADTATVLLRIAVTGDIDAVQVVGADLPIASLAWSGPDQASFLLVSDYICDSSQPFVVAADGVSLEPLPIGCEMEPLDDARGYVAAIPRTP